MYTIIAQPMTKRKGRNREKKKNSWEKCYDGIEQFGHSYQPMDKSLQPKGISIKCLTAPFIPSSLRSTKLTHVWKNKNEWTSSQ